MRLLGVTLLETTLLEIAGDCVTRDCWVSHYWSLLAFVPLKIAGIRVTESCIARDCRASRYLRLLGFALLGLLEFALLETVGFHVIRDCWVSHY